MSDTVRTVVCSECGVRIHTAYVMQEGQCLCLHCAGYKKESDQDQPMPGRKMTSGGALEQKAGT